MEGETRAAANVSLDKITPIAFTHPPIRVPRHAMGQPMPMHQSLALRTSWPWSAKLGKSARVHDASARVLECMRHVHRHAHRDTWSAGYACKAVPHVGYVSVSPSRVQ